MKKKTTKFDGTPWRESKVLKDAVEEFKKTPSYGNMSQVCPTASLQAAFCMGWSMLLNKLEGK